jgi:hypothetical protein
MELAHAADRLRDVEVNGSWWRFFHTRIDAWDAYRDVLAATLGTDHRTAVSQSVGELRELDKGIEPRAWKVRFLRRSVELNSA